MRIDLFIMKPKEEEEEEETEEEEHLLIKVEGSNLVALMK